MASRVLRNKITGELMNAAELGQFVDTYLQGDWEYAPDSLYKAPVAAGTQGKELSRTLDPYSLTNTGLQRTQRANAEAPTGGRKFTAVGRNGEKREFTSLEEIEPFLKAGGQLQDPVDGHLMVGTPGVYGGWLFDGLPFNILEGKGWYPGQDKAIANYWAAGWRPGQPALQQPPPLPMEALQHYQGGDTRSLKPVNLRLISPTGERWDGYDYTQIQQKLDQGWGVMEGENVLGSDRVRRFREGWLIDDRPVNTVVSGLIDPKQRQALIDDGRWHPEWDDPSNPNYISQVGLDDPRHSWTTPGLRFNQETGQFDPTDEVAAPPPGGGDPGTFGDLAEGFTEKFNYRGGPSEFAYPNQKFSFTPEDYQKSPDFDFVMNEGLKAVEGRASARGLLKSGGTLKGLSRFAKDLQSQDYGLARNRALEEFNLDTDRALTKYGLDRGVESEKYGRAFGEFGTRFDVDRANKNDVYNRYAGLSGTGMTATGNLGQLGSNFATRTGNTLTDQGTANAFGRTAGARARANMYRNIGNDVAGYYGLSRTGL